VSAKDFAAALRRLGACGEARVWASGRTLQQAWAECPRGDWLLWLAGRAGVERKVVVLAACACARLALKHVRPGEERPLRAVETAEAWARGDASVSLEDVRKAARAADAAAAYAFAAFAAAYAAYAAFAAADAAYAAADAAYAAADAAYAADAADAAADAADAARTTLAECADIVRAHIPVALVADALGGAK